MHYTMTEEQIKKEITKIKEELKNPNITWTRKAELRDKYLQLVASL